MTLICSFTTSMSVTILITILVAFMTETAKANTVHITKADNQKQKEFATTSLCDPQHCHFGFRCVNDECVCSGVVTEGNCLPECEHDDDCKDDDGNSYSFSCQDNKICGCDGYVKGSACYIQACTGDTECDNLLRNSTCIDDTCKCNGYYSSSTNTCHRSDCDDTQSCSDGFTCIENTCTCDGYNSGHECNPNVAYYEKCNYDQQCQSTDLNMACMYSYDAYQTICICQTDYHYNGTYQESSNTYSNDGVCIYSPGGCFNDPDCETDNGFTCIDNTCGCKGYVTSYNDCEIEECSINDYCSISGMTCVDGICVCDGYYDGYNNCFQKAGYFEDCTYNEQCQLVDNNTFCFDERRCYCADGYHREKTLPEEGRVSVDGVCVKGQAGLGQFCTGSNWNCQENMKCVEHTLYYSDSYFHAYICECDYAIPDLKSGTCRDLNLSDPDGGMVAGIIIGGLALVALVVVIIVLCMRRQYKRTLPKLVKNGVIVS